METPQVLVHRRGNKKGLIARASGTGSVKVCRKTRKLLEPYGWHRDSSCASARSVRAQVAETSPCPLRDDPIRQSLKPIGRLVAVCREGVVPVGSRPLLSCCCRTQGMLPCQSLVGATSTFRVWPLTGQPREKRAG